MLGSVRRGRWGGRGPGRGLASASAPGAAGFTPVLLALAPVSCICFGYSVAILVLLSLYSLSARSCGEFATISHSAFGDSSVGGCWVQKVFPSGWI